MRSSFSSGMSLAANAGGRGYESHRGQDLFVTFYFIRVEFEELFCQTKVCLKSNPLNIYNTI